MTCEELFVAIDDAAPQLPDCTLRLLLKLIATALRTGSHEVRVSDRWLRREMKTARYSVSVAKRGLAGVVPWQAGHGQLTTYWLPAEWFSPQRSLFIAPGGSETRPKLAQKPGQDWPGNQATDGLENGPPGLETRPAWPGNKATLAQKPGQTALETRPLGPETRPDFTQNQQLAAGARSDLIRQNRPEDREIEALILRVLRAEQIPEEQRQDAYNLRLTAEHYARSWEHKNGMTTPLSDKMLAKLMRIAPAARLTEEIALMKDERIPFGRKYSWLVVTLLNRIHGVDHRLTVQYLKRNVHRKPPETAAPESFQTEMQQLMPQLMKHTQLSASRK